MSKATACQTALAMLVAVMLSGCSTTDPAGKEETGTASEGPVNPDTPPDDGVVDMEPATEIKINGSGYVVVRIDADSSPWNYRIQANWTGPDWFTDGMAAVTLPEGESGTLATAGFRYRSGTAPQEQVTAGAAGHNQVVSVGVPPIVHGLVDSKPFMNGTIDPGDYLPSGDNGSVFVGFWFEGSVTDLDWRFWGDDLRGAAFHFNGTSSPIVPIYGGTHVSSAAGTVDQTVTPAWSDGAALVAGFDVRQTRVSPTVLQSPTDDSTSVDLISAMVAPTGGAWYLTREPGAGDGRAASWAMAVFEFPSQLLSRETQGIIDESM